MVKRDPSAEKDLRKPVSKLSAIKSTSANAVYTKTIFSDAILAMINAPAESVNGVLDLDEDFLRNLGGVTDFAKYSVVPGATPRRIMPARFPVLEVEEQNDEGKRIDSTKIRREKSNL